MGFQLSYNNVSESGLNLVKRVCVFAEYDSNELWKHVREGIPTYLDFYSPFQKEVDHTANLPLEHELGFHCDYF